MSIYCSMFVLLKGRTVKESFQIGNEIASAVTAMNPNPVTLKMEKVYQPCFLITKKRYVGYSYESPNQIEPVFDAKGIETVRRDTCGAVAKIMEQSLRLFFEHQSLLEVYMLAYYIFPVYITLHKLMCVLLLFEYFPDLLFFILWIYF